VEQNLIIDGVQSHVLLAGWLWYTSEFKCLLLLLLLIEINVLIW